MADDLLTAEIEALWQQLDGLEAKLNTVRTVNAALIDQVRSGPAGLDQAIADKRAWLQQIYRDNAAGRPPEESWDDFAAAKQSCTDLFSEALALSTGALARAYGLDDGLCAIADALLAELSEKANIGWKRFTIPSSDEFLGTLAQIIRLRFPAYSIWYLPIAAHEFGHYIGKRLEDQPPDGSHDLSFKQMLDAETRNQDANAPLRLHEQFADLFATYALGPAWAATCLLLSFDPRHAYSVPAPYQHPPAAARAHCILRTLRAMDSEPNLPAHWSVIVDDLEARWAESLKVAGPPPTRWGEVLQEYVERHDRLFALLRLSANLTALHPLRNGVWLAATTLARDWQRDLAHQQPALGTSLVTVLNAAWRCRMYQLAPADDLARAAQAMCINLAR